MVVEQVRKNFLVFGQPAIGNAEIDEVVDTLKSGWLGAGPKTEKFVNMFKEYTGGKYAVPTNSCTSALHLSGLLCNVKKGDEVITTPMTFCATSNVIERLGAKPVFVDIRKETMNIHPEDINECITDRTKSIVPVHFAGRPCDMRGIMDIAKENNLYVIEDAAHAIESTIKGKHTGTFGDFGCFSFYPTKNVAMGDGGMLLTTNEDFGQKAHILSTQGMIREAWGRFSSDDFKHMQVKYSGYKYNLTDVMSSIGIHQLDRIEKNWRRRKEIWERYNKAFENLPCFVPAPTKPDEKHAMHLYTLIIDIDNISVSRDTVLKKILNENIGVGVHYISLHLQPYYKEKYDFKENDFPNAKWISDRTVSLPLSPKLGDNDVDDVINVVTKVLNEVSN